MASLLKVDKLDPQSGTALEIGTSGDTLNVPSGVTLDINSGATLDATGATVTGAGLDYLGTTTVSAAASTVDITLDTTNYGSFKFMLNAVLTETASDDVLNMRYSTDSGSSFADGASDYGYASWEQRNGGSFSSNIDNDTSTFPMNQGETNIGTSANESPSYEITLWNNQLYPKVSCIGGAINSSANFTQWYRTAIFMTASTVNAVRFYWSSGGFDGGTIDKYGFTK